MLITVIVMIIIMIIIIVAPVPCANDLGTNTQDLTAGFTQKCRIKAFYHTNYHVDHSYLH